MATTRKTADQDQNDQDHNDLEQNDQYQNYQLAESAHRILEAFLNGHRAHDTLTDDVIKDYVEKAYAISQTFFKYKP